MILGIMCALQGATRPYLFMVVGFAVFAAIHIVGIHLQLKGKIQEGDSLQPFWTLGRAFVLAGLWLLLPSRRKGEARVETGERLPVELAERGRHYSQLSSLLIVLALGAVFVVAAFERVLEQQRQWFSMFLVLFGVTCAIVMSIATSRFDRAIDHVREQVAGVFRSGLAKIESDDGERGIQRTLELAGLDRVLAEFRQRATQLRGDVIVLGPEKFNRPAQQHSSGAVPRCFIVMPFGPEWSTAVHRVIRRVCRSAGVQAVRGDDIFSPTDILDDIWQQIVAADFVIADVTDQNTNVFYELGMAHAIGKPVILLSQRETDIPIDLKTRRWHCYEPGKEEQLAELLRQSIQWVLNDYGIGTAATAIARDSTAPPRNDTGDRATSLASGA